MCVIMWCSRGVRMITACERFDRWHSDAMLLDTDSCSCGCLATTAASATACLARNTSVRVVSSVIGSLPSVSAASLSSKVEALINISSSVSDSFGSEIAGFITKSCWEKLGGSCVHSKMGRMCTADAGALSSCSSSYSALTGADNGRARAREVPPLGAPAYLGIAHRTQPVERRRRGARPL